LLTFETAPFFYVYPVFVSKNTLKPLQNPVNPNDLFLNALNSNALNKTDTLSTIYEKGKFKNTRLPVSVKENKPHI